MYNSESLFDLKVKTNQEKKTLSTRFSEPNALEQRRKVGNSSSLSHVICRARTPN